MTCTNRLGTAVLLGSALLLVNCLPNQASSGPGSPGGPGSPTGSAAPSNRCAGIGLDDVGCGCTVGAKQPCWTGDPALRGRGDCHDGVQECAPVPTGGETFNTPSWGECTGA